MSDILIWISDEEWINFPKEKRERLKKLMQEYDLDIEDLIKVEKEHEEKQAKKKSEYDDEVFD